MDVGGSYISKDKVLMNLHFKGIVQRYYARGSQNMFYLKCFSFLSLLVWCTGLVAPFRTAPRRYTIKSTVLWTLPSHVKSLNSLLRHPVLYLPWIWSVLCMILISNGILRNRCARVEFNLNYSNCLKHFVKKKSKRRILLI